MRSSRSLKTFFLAFIALSLFFSFSASVSAQTPTSPQNVPGGAGESIAKLLCAPDDSGTVDSKQGIYTCVNNGYKIVIVLGSLGAVFWIIVAGYLYMASDGSQESVTKAKEILVSTVAGMFIILMTFVFLKQLNPELVRFPAIDLQTIALNPGGTLLSPFDECMLRYSGNKPLQDQYCSGLSHDVPGGGGSSPITPGQKMQGKGGVSCSLGDLKSVANESAKCSTQYDQFIKKASEKHGIEVAFIKAMIHVESNWQEKVCSDKSACGIMQMIAGTAVANGCSADDRKIPEKAIDCGTRYMAKIKNNPVSKGSYYFVAGLYNSGEGPKASGPSLKCPGSGLQVWQCPFTSSAQNACEQGGYEETRNHAITVMHLYDKYKKCGN